MKKKKVNSVQFTVGDIAEAVCVMAVDEVVFKQCEGRKMVDIVDMFDLLKGFGHKYDYSPHNFEPSHETFKRNKKLFNDLCNIGKTINSHDKFIKEMRSIGFRMRKSNFGLFSAKLAIGALFMFVNALETNHESYKIKCIECEWDMFYNVEAI